MAEKAILITNANRETLANRFIEDESTGVPLAVGYYLVMGFGEHLGREVLSAAVFNEVYTKGPEIRNGFFEAVKKDIPNG